MARPLERINEQPAPIDVDGLEATLRRTVEGEVRFDDGTRALYAVDASNYRQVPIGVVVPRSTDDVVATVAACRGFGAPLLSRGGGTSLAGQCCNVAVVIDWSKYMHHIRALDAERRLARVEPGVICDQLSDAGRPHRLMWGPAPATHDHCCFGGMLGNDSCGVHSQFAGKAIDNTEELDVLLYDGTRMRVGWMDEAQLDAAAHQRGRVGEIHARIKTLRDRWAAKIRARFPNLPRRVSGYALDELLPGEDGRFNLARALVGTESTCVTILEATVRLVPSHPERVLVLVGYPDVYHAGDHVPELRRFAPIGLEGIDGKLIANIRKKGGPTAEYLSLLPERGAWLLLEFGADRRDEAIQRARDAMDHIRANAKLVTDPLEQQHVWHVRESGLGATAFVPGEPLTWEGWEDSAVPPDAVGQYLRDLRALYDRYGYDSALYGHFGQGCIHCRVSFDLMTPAGIATWKAFMDDATDLVVRHGGSLSGEHGDGQSRAQFLSKMFGDELVGAFGEFKSIWDPDWRMNPGKVVEPYRIDQNLRLGADYRPWQPLTHFKFPEDKGLLANATLRCVGVGLCRRLAGHGEHDTMCPSFMVTREEKDSTRGRAHALWEMLEGNVLEDGWRDEHVKDTLELCLSCKGCKSDCPVNVDVATYKAEFLSHYWEGRLRPRHAYAFGLIDRWARVAAAAPGLANLATQLPLVRALAKLAAGVPTARAIPAFAPETFQAWFRRRGPRNLGASTVLLWPDTFNNHFLPGTARAAVEVLEAAGWHVVVPPGHLCCGRPLYDYGMLARAKRYLLDVLARLRPALDTGTPFVVLEPSCAAVFRDELHGLFPEREDARRLASQTFLLSEFLERKSPGWKPPQLARRAIVQGHCHQKAIMRMVDEETVLGRMGIDFEVLESGCCGMAGSFGYEKDKYDVSIACGERVLLPAVRRAERSTLVIADGFSCREQIAQATDREALHLADVLQLALRGEASVPAEAPVVAARQTAVRRSMARAGVLLGAVTAVALVARR